MLKSSNGNICRVTGHLCRKSPHKGHWRGALIFSLICVWINGWVNNGDACDLRRHRAHYDSNDGSFPSKFRYTNATTIWFILFFVRCQCTKGFIFNLNISELFVRLVDLMKDPPWNTNSLYGAHAIQLQLFCVLCGEQHLDIIFNLDILVYDDKVKKRTIRKATYLIWCIIQWVE